MRLKGMLFSALCFGSICTANRAMAGVNVNNGNYYIAYRDFYLPTEGINLEVTRTYNSRSSFISGSFGIGWSTEFDGYLKIEKDKLVYFEGGGGNVVNFDKEVVAEAAKGKKDAKSVSVWSSKAFGLQTIKLDGDVYKLESTSGKLINFDKQGRLTRISDKNKNYVDFSYENGSLSLIKDNFNNQLKITWGNFGSYKRITLIEKGDQKSRYEYSTNGDLVKAVGADGVSYAYEYDDEHNMTKISYADGTHRAMAYNKVKDWITRFRDIDGVVTSYDYYSDSLDPENKFGTTVVRSQEGSKDKETSRFWYEFKKRPDGSRYNARTVTLFKSQVMETIFTECCGTPAVISQWMNGEADKLPQNSQAWTTAKNDKKVTMFDYYSDGLLKKKTSPNGTITEITYDNVHKKVANIKRAGRELSYKYDSRGNLATAFDSLENKKIDLTYDLNGRITYLKEEIKEGTKLNARTVFFRYDGKGRPVEIKETSKEWGNNLIKLVYDSNGNMKEVLNSKDRSIASAGEMEAAQRIVGTFQNLLNVVQPQGVSLTPDT